MIAPDPPENAADDPGPAPRRGRRGGAAVMGLNLTPMIDVVFQLLIYFMAATEFRLGEEIYRTDLPQRSSSSDPFDLPRDPLRIGVASIAGGGSRGYVLRVQGLASEPRTFQELFDLLASARRDPGGLGGLFEPDHPIVIEPDAKARWEHAMEAFNAAARARYTNITFQGRGP